MPRNRSQVEIAAGKLTSAIQKEWASELGDASAPESERVLHKCQALARSIIEQSHETELAGRTISDYLGTAWLGEHPAVRPAIAALESAIASRQHA
jgi:hypothetical protein